ncbi:hypothetical protein, partial [Streptomyces sp. NRRL S-4]|uniref:hypothetical protein n=1 Tax=Streptomyces sp. NRRL S-4 TaxID=1519471 RepID=UPI0006CD81FF
MINRTRTKTNPINHTRRNRLQPKMLTLERIRRQVHAAGADAGEVRHPVDGPSVYVEFGKRSDQRLRLRTVLAQG